MTDDPPPQRALAVVAEDEPLMRMEVADFLGDEGFAVSEASNAAEALAELERLGGVALLFTDIRMPGPCDGLGLARAVAERWPETRIVVCSGLLDPDLSTLPGTARFFAKPFLPSAMRRALGKTAG